MSPERIFKMRHRYLKECRALQKKKHDEERKNNHLVKKEVDEFDPSQIFDKFTFIKIKV